MPNKKDKINDEEIIADEDFVDLDEDRVRDNGDKIRQLKEKLALCQKEKQDHLLGWQRAQADYVNLKNETEKRQVAMAKFASEKVLIDLLPVFDSFKMAFADKEAWEKTPANWRQGIEYIYNQLESTLADHGLKKIEALGQAFNPNEHQSVGTISTDKKTDDHKVLEVIKDGFTFHEKIIRPALVKIGSLEK